MAKYQRGAFWTQRILTSSSWNHWTVNLGLPAPSPNLTLIQPQKLILRPTQSSVWGKCGERSLHIGPAYRLVAMNGWSMTISRKMSGWVQRPSSRQCQLAPVWEPGPWKTSVLMHFLPVHQGPWGDIVLVLEASVMCGSFLIRCGTSI